MIMGAYRKRLIGRLFNFLNNKKKSWKEIEYFNPQWKERIIRMYEHIKDANSIVDYGCGEMWLKELNEFEIAYDKWIIEIDNQIVKTKKKKK